MTLERIPRKNSPNVVYLQHGVFDTSFAWIATGASSLAFRAYDMNFDVWMGNLRGANGDERSHVNKNISSKEFWNFSINEHAFNDLPAFIQKIVQVKKEENCANGISINAVAHSVSLSSVINDFFRIYNTNCARWGQLPRSCTLLILAYIMSLTIYRKQFCYPLLDITKR